MAGELSQEVIDDAVQRIKEGGAPLLWVNPEGVVEEWCWGQVLCPVKERLWGWGARVFILPHGLAVIGGR